LHAWHRIALLVVVAGWAAGCSDSVHNLVARGDIESLRARLRADPSACDDRNREGKTALHYAINFAQRDAFAVLVELGECDFNAADQTGMTPLHSAAFIGLPAAAGPLIEHGADVNARDRFGDTPLHTAAMFGHVDMLESLLAAGADPTLSNNDGRTPRELAEYYEKREAAGLLSAREQP
jgi:cytohesin